VRRGGPRRIYHRGRRRFGLFNWIKLIAMGGMLVGFIGYLLWLYVFQPATGAPVLRLWIPLVVR
jgi:hypothetical protein